MARAKWAGDLDMEIWRLVGHTEVQGVTNHGRQTWPACEYVSQRSKDPDLVGLSVKIHPFLSTTPDADAEWSLLSG